MGEIRCAYACSSSSKNLFCNRAISFCSLCVKYNSSINFLFCPFLLEKQQIFYMDDELRFIKGQLQNADLIYRSISIQHPIYKFIQSTPSTLCRCCYFTLFLLLLLLHQDRIAHRSLELCLECKVTFPPMFSYCAANWNPCEICVFFLP